jgi:zinc/manganese transport system substrate-binding protein
MNMKKSGVLLMILCLLRAALGAADPSGQAPIRVVTTLPTYASIAREVGGDLVEVSHIAEVNQDAHFVSPKPSYSLMLRDADLFVTTGLDLELWVPVVMDKSGNPSIREGQKGYVSVSRGIALLQKPATGATRAEGDVHIYGNPHIHTGPLNAVKIAENIMIGLQKVSPGNADTFHERYEDFRDRVYRALFGDELVELFGGEKLARLFASGKFYSFLEDEHINQMVGGPPLTERLGGWLAKARPLRGKQIIAYHKNWIYFASTFGLKIADYVEPKPGIPPSARHVSNIIDLIETQGIKAMLVAKYFEETTPKRIEQKTGAKALFVTLDVGGAPGVDDYFSLVDSWLDPLIGAVGK